LYGYVPLEKSPEVLRERAREIINKAGYSSPATDYMDDLEDDGAPLEYIARTDPRPERWQDLKDGQPAPIYYWYRQSPGYLGEFDYFRSRWTNPPPIMSGMAGVKLDTRGRLLSLYAVPLQIDPVPSHNGVSSSEFRVPSQQGNSSTVTEDSRTDFASSKSQVSSSESQELETRNSKLETDLWSPLFTEAGLEMGNFKPTASKWAPLYMNDERAAWEGVYPEQPTIPIRIEAASYRGKPVYFEIVNPWNKPERQEPTGLPQRLRVLFLLLISVFVLVLIGSVLLAIRNLRLGRGDRRGALRLAIVVFTLILFSRLVSAHHVPAGSEFGTFLNGLEDSVFAASFFWVIYIALEPFVRRRWPHRIISWTRLLAGDFRDPMVGRDVLIGAVFGVGIAVWQLGFFHARAWLGDPSLIPAIEPANDKLGIGHFVEAFTDQMTVPLVNTFQFLFLVLLLTIIFRRDWLGFIVGWLLFTTGLAFLWGGALPNWVSAAITAGLTTFVLFRYGLLAALFALFFLHIYLQFPVTTQLTAWYAPGFILDLIIMLSVAFYAFYTSLGGQPLFAGRLLQDD
jgi:hypothetical protein